MGAQKFIKSAKRLLQNGLRISLETEIAGLIMLCEVNVYVLEHPIPAYKCNC